VPRHKLPWILEQVYRVRDKYGVTLANVFHAGDGNLHPNILFDKRDPAQVEKMKKAAGEIFSTSVRLGGTLSGEHGVGDLKLPFLE
jgi:glycolate oxidase